jgi:hypothetical protein
VTTLVNNPVDPFPGVDFDSIADEGDQLQALAKDLAIDEFLLDHVQPHIPNLDVASSIVDGYIERTVEGASTLQIVLNDPRLAILKSGLLNNDAGKMRSIDVELDGLWFSLSDINKSGNDVTMTFEDQIVAELRKHDSFRKASRAKMTRAQFIRMLLREVKRVPIRMYSPEIGVKQKIQPLTKADAERIRQTQRGPGFGAHYHIKIGDTTLGEQQKKDIQAALDEADAERLSKKGNIIMLMVILQESMGKRGATNGLHVGLFQQDSQPGSTWRQLGGASRDPAKDAKAFIHQLKPFLKSQPDGKYADLAEAVQHSGQGKEYAKWKDDAERIYKAYGGAPTSVTRYKHYEYTRGINGQKENTWDCAKRLGKEVEWRVFVVSGTFYYVSETYLFRSKPRALLIPGDGHGTDEINFDWKSGKVIKECTVTARAARWAIPPGTIVEVDESYGPVAGKWLVSTINRPLFSRIASVTLRKPVHAKLEPAAGIVTRSVSGDTGNDVSFTGGRLRGGTIRDRIVAAAEKAHAHVNSYHYAQARPMAKSLFSQEAYRKGIDCSEFVTLCYKAAGARDPNGLDYNGSGYTGTLESHGRYTSKPHPGDLVFYGPGEASGGAPGHVGIYIGNGEVIEMGGTPGPLKVKTKYRSDFIGYMRFDLGKPFPLHPVVH